MIRLDQELVTRGLCESREKAKRAIMAGQVKVNENIASKPSDTVDTTDTIELLAPEKFVSRGGHKLEHALQHFPVNVTGLTAIDIGASTGGFTDCLLQHGATKVFAVDVGQGQLAWKLRRDKHVVVMEKTNARGLTPASFPKPFHPFDVAVIDCSFISLRKILPPAIALLKASGKIVALIKPQFEAGKAEADKGAGVITDPAVHERVLRELEEFVGKQAGLRWRGVTESPLLGPAGNKEFLALIEKAAEKIKRIGLIGNSQKIPFARTLRNAAKLVRASGRQVFSDASTADLSGIDAIVYPNVAALSRAVDLLLVFGGDGTMLRVAREIDGSDTPILGINIGNLGFLTAVPSTELAAGLKQIWAGEYTFESRALIEAGAHCDGKLFLRRAFNDFVVARSNGSRLIELEVSVDGEPVTRYRCDGLIISSPTGSTAYSLAAGGAVADPRAEVFQLTPICPHTLTNRSLMLPLTSVIAVKVITPEPPCLLSADGQVVSELSAGDAITIRRSRKSVRLMQLNGNSFFKTLRQKLHWRGANI